MIRVAHCDYNVSANNMVCAEHLLSSYEFGVLVHTYPILTKALGTEFLMSFLGGQHLICVVTIYCWEIKCAPNDFTEKGSLEVCAWFPPALLQTPFPFADFALYPFPVRNHSYEYDLMPSAMNPPSEIQT